jgi:hypothetical protein
MTDERCIICGETEEGTPSAEAAHFQMPTHVHSFCPPSLLKIVAIDKKTGAREEITDLYWFEERGVHSFVDDQYDFEVTAQPKPLLGEVE